MEQKRKRKKRIFMSVAIIATAVALSGYLMFSPNGGGRVSETHPSNKNPGSGLSAIDPSLNFTIKSLNNLTGQFTDQALKELMGKNQNVAITKNVKNAKLLPDPKDVDQIISKIMDEQAKEITVNDSDILINNDNSKDTQRIYIVFVNELIKQELSSLASPDLSGTSIDQYFNSVAGQLKKISDVLTAVMVPPAWKDIHKQLISFFLTQENVFQSLGAANADPLRFMIASNRVLSQEIDGQFSKIKDAINKKIKNEGLI